MAKIISFEMELFRLPLSEILVDAKYVEHSHFELIITLIKVTNGLNCTSYTYTGGYGGYSIKAMIDNTIEPFILRKDGSKVEKIIKQLYWYTYYVGRGGAAIFLTLAIDKALWDIRRKELSLPLWRMAGVSDNKCRTYFGGIVEMHSFSIENYTFRPVKSEDILAIAPENYGIGVIFNWDKLRENSK